MKTIIQALILFNSVFSVLLYSSEYELNFLLLELLKLAVWPEGLPWPAGFWHILLFHFGYLLLSVYVLSPDGTIQINAQFLIPKNLPKLKSAKGKDILCFC